MKEQLANQIKTAAAELNKALAEAYEAGLQVEVKGSSSSRAMAGPEEVVVTVFERIVY